MPKRPEDRYTNLASAVVTESAAGTLTFAELVTGISLGQGVGMLFDQIDYYVSTSYTELMIGAGDSIQAGWFTSNAPSSMDMNDRRLIHMMELRGETPLGTPASAGRVVKMPQQFKFSPPIIVAAPRVYLGVRGGSLASVVQVVSRFYFRYIPLTDKEYLELAETFILVG